jgi:hypothetical protein
MKKRRVNYFAFTDFFFVVTSFVSYDGKDSFSLDDEIKEFGLYNIKVQRYYSSVIDIYDYIKKIN